MWCDQAKYPMHNQIQSKSDDYNFIHDDYNLIQVYNSKEEKSRGNLYCVNTVII